MKKRCIGIGLVDFCLGMVLYSAAIIIIISMFSHFSTRLIRGYQIDDFATSVFSGMKNYYWNNVGQTGCLAPPSDISLNDLIDDDLLNEQYLDDAIYKASSTILSYSEASSVAIPTMMNITLYYKKNNKRSGDEYVSGKYIYSYDNSSHSLTISAPLDLNDLSYQYINTLNNKACESD